MMCCAMKQRVHLTQLLLLPLMMTITTAVEFAPIFDASINSKTVHMDCKYLNKDICCSALEEEPLRESPDLGVSMEMISKIQQTGSCVTTKEYVPSPYETRHLLKAKEISRLSNYDDKVKAILTFISQSEEVIASQKWLNRVKMRMRPNVINKRKNGINDPLTRLRKAYHGGSGNYRKRTSGKDKRSLLERTSSATYQPMHPDDKEYMSRFVVKKTCSSNSQLRPNTTREWVEWIEPLSVHGRHPFGEYMYIVCLIISLCMNIASC